MCGRWKEAERLGVCLGMLVLCAGCTIQVPRAEMGLAGLDYTYTHPLAGDYGGAKVGVFAFDGPSTAPEVSTVPAPDVGSAAARFLYQGLLREGVFPQVFPEFDRRSPGLDYRLEIAREKGYDLIISGEVLYYFDGSGLQASQAHEALRVFDVATRQMVCYAEARAIAEPSYESDYFVVVIKGEDAPPALELLSLNARKFCRFLAGDVVR